MANITIEEEKWCSSCKKKKPLSEFYERKSPGRGRGRYVTPCIECDKKKVREWQIKNHEHRQNYINEYRRKNWQRLRRQMSEYNAKQLKSNPEFTFKYKVRKKFLHRIEKGKIKRQNCIIKDCQNIGQGHHSDYEKPFDVTWLCQKHHRELHDKEKKKLCAVPKGEFFGENNE